MTPEMEPLAAAYLAGDLDDEGRRRLEEHLRRHPGDRAEFAELARQSKVLEELLGAKRAADLPRAVTEELLAKTDQDRFVKAVSQQIRGRRRLKYGAAAALLLAAAGAFLLARPRPSPEGIVVAAPKEAPTPAPPPPTPPVEPPLPAVPVVPTLEPPKPIEVPTPKSEESRPETIEPKLPPLPSVANPPPAKEGPPPRQTQETLAAIATLEDVTGEVAALVGEEFVPVRPGQAVREGQTLRTVGALSAATFKFPDGTWVQLWGDTEVAEVSGGRPEPGQGKRLRIVRGAVASEVSKQPARRSMVFDTPQGKATVLGTVLRLQVGAGSTTLEVDEGRVELRRSSDGRMADVAGGQYAVAAPGIDLVARSFVQDKKKKPLAAHPKVDQVKVDAAVAKGIAALKGSVDGLKSFVRYEVHFQSDELVLWTFLHAGVPESDPDFQKLLKRMLERKLESTYCVALEAMVLEELDRVKYQGYIARCAQFLVDNQCKNGQWSYGSPSPFADDIPTGGPARKDTATGGSRVKDLSRATGERQKPKVVRRIAVAKRRDGPDIGDNSNAQYAALGLRACHDAGILLPKDVVLQASKWWREAQQKSEPGGWDYGAGGGAYGSMTAGAIGSLTIYHFILNEPWKTDPEVVNGLKWLAANYSVAEHPGHPIAPNDRTWDTMKYYYYLYALERAGMLYETEKIGDHEWYPDGAKVLLESQKPEGPWGGGVDDTCFAILFLRRATRKLIDVASVDRRK